MSSMLPVLASPAAIPSQALTLTFSPIWTAALFVTALVLTCGAMWMLKNVEQRSRSLPRERRPISLAFPRQPRPAVAGAGRHAA